MLSPLAGSCGLLLRPPSACLTPTATIIIISPISIIIRVVIAVISPISIIIRVVIAVISHISIIIIVVIAIISHISVIIIVVIVVAASLPACLPVSLNPTGQDRWPPT